MCQFAQVDRLGFGGGLPGLDRTQRDSQVDQYLPHYLDPQFELGSLFHRVLHSRCENSSSMPAKYPKSSADFSETGYVLIAQTSGSPAMNTMFPGLSASPLVCVGDLGWAAT